MKTAGKENNRASNPASNTDGNQSWISVRLT